MAEHFYMYVVQKFDVIQQRKLWPFVMVLFNDLLLCHINLSSKIRGVSQLPVASFSLNLFKIVFDECHKAKNLCPVGSSKPTKTGQTVLELQNRLPKARIVYASATGASEPKKHGLHDQAGSVGDQEHHSRNSTTSFRLWKKGDMVLYINSVYHMFLVLWSEISLFHN